MVKKRARETENPTQTPWNDAKSLTQCCSPSSLGQGGVQLWGDWGAADSSFVKSDKRGMDNDLI